jgi:hypothetical protein
MDPDKATGIATRVVDQFKKRFADDVPIDITSPDTLKLIEHEIQVHAVQRAAWVELACLYTLGEFNPKSYLSVEFRNEDGSLSHSTTLVAGLQSSFPFLRRLMEIPVHHSGRARLSQEANDCLRDYCSRVNIPETVYKVLDSLPTIGQSMMTDCQVINYGWKP